MDKIIGYFKITPYIFEIEILYVHDDNRVLITNEQKLNAKYNVIIFQVISIKHMITNEFTIFAKNYQINIIYEKYITFYLTYERAFNDKFFENKEYKLFSNGYSGIYNEYDDDGLLKKTFYHKNGVIDGEVLFYDNLNNVMYIHIYKKGTKIGIYNVALDEVISLNLQ
jgi:antitoxin component YwqK of YwqJK toxin-antitoxin module